MKSHHTITITIPTRAILYVVAAVLVGLLVGLVLIALHALGVELLTPVAGLPLVRTLVKASAVPDATSTAWTPPVYTGDHPALIAFDTVPFPVQVALNDMVDRVLAEKWRTAA
jgi:hypothetical protein